MRQKVEDAVPNHLPTGSKRMSPIVLAAVLFAAALHAIWNAIAKGGLDKREAIGAIALGHVPFALLSFSLAPVPAKECLPYLGCGILLHLGYQFFLMHSYRLGDLTQVYPIARGSAPLIVALISVAFLGVHLSGIEILAITIIGAGIVSLGLVRRADGQRNPNAAMLAMTTGLFIASYSLIDGMGARVAGTALGFYAWLAIGNGIAMMLYLAIRSPKTLFAISRRGKRTFFIGGGASFAAYALVTWAFTQAPVALVAAVRETSIIFALLIGVFFLKERLDLFKIASTMTTLLGAAILKFAR